MFWLILGISSALADRGQIVGAEIAVEETVMFGPHVERTMKSGMLATNASASMWVAPDDDWLGTARFSGLLGVPIRDCNWLPSDYELYSTYSTDEPGCIMGLEVGALTVVTPEGAKHGIDVGLGTGKAAQWVTLSAEWRPVDGWGGVRVRGVVMSKRRHGAGVVFDMRLTEFDSDDRMEVWTSLALGVSTLRKG